MMATINSRLILFLCFHLTLGMEVQTVQLPLTVGIHAGLRSDQSSTLVPLVTINLLSWIESYITNFNIRPDKPLDVVVWLDATSFEGRDETFICTVREMRNSLTILETHYDFLHTSIRYSQGLAYSYLRLMTDCTVDRTCHYVVFLVRPCQKDCL